MSASSTFTSPMRLLSSPSRQTDPLNRPALLKFQESYGSIADDESSVNLFKLYNSITKTLELYTASGFDCLNEDLSCSAYTLSLLNIVPPPRSIYDASESSEFQSGHIPCMPGCCNPDFHKIVSEGMPLLFSKQEAIYKEFEQKPLNPSYPLEDLRHRCCGVLTMHKVRLILCLWGELHMHQEHLLKMVREGKQSRIIPHVIPQFTGSETVRFSDFTQQKFHTFSESQIYFFGKIRPIVITGHIETGPLSRKQILKEAMPISTIFKIFTKGTNVLLGSIQIHKCWQTKTTESEGGVQSLELWNEHSYIPPTPVKPYCLSIDSIQIMHNRREENSGDYPILRTLIKTVVQVFLADRFDLLKVQAYDIHACIFYAAGFRGSTNDAKLVAEIRDARCNLKMFPQRSNTSLSTLWLKKNEMLERPLEYFFPMDELEPKSWDQIMEQDPPLGKIEGPILPKYNLRNVSKFE